MALSDTTIVDIELVNTFEVWRTTTNRIITLLNESADDNPFTAIVTANSEGGFKINSIQTNAATITDISTANIVATGSTSSIDFSGANVASIGNVHQAHILGGLNITGSNPSSSISNTQINNSEINLNGQQLKANGASTIDFGQATVESLGTVEFIEVIPAQVGASGGTIAGVNVVSNNSYTSNLRLNGGAHTFDGSTVNGGLFDSITLTDSFIHTTNISMNTGATFIANTGVILGSDVTNSNTAIGYFPEWSGGANRVPTSSKGRLHIRTHFSHDNAVETSPAISLDGSELVVEGNTTVGMTLLSNSSSMSHIFFGDEDDTDQAFIKYDNTNDHMIFGAKSSASKLRIQNDGGGSMQLAGANTFETLAGKFHIFQSSLDGLDALHIHTTASDKRAVKIDVESESANAFEITSTSLTSGHMMSLEYGSSTTSFTGSMLNVNDNNQETSNRKLVSIVQDHRDATGTQTLYLQSDGGELLEMAQNREDKKAIVLNANTTTANVSEYHMDKLTTGTGFHISSDSDNHTTNLVSLITNSTSATATTLSIKNISSTNQNLVSVANSSGSVALIETGGNVGININGQTVKRLAANGSLIESTASIPLHKFHVHGTMGVEEESIFNADMRINANVTIQNGQDTILMIDSPDVGSATLAVGENADTEGHQAFYVAYPVGDGYSYLGMGQLDARVPSNYALRFNGFNSDLKMTGDITMDKTLTVNNDITVNDGDITSNGLFTLTGNAYITSNTLIVQSVEGVGNTIIDDVLTTTGNTIVQGELNVESANTRLGSNLVVVGNTSIQENITVTNTATFSNTVTVEGVTTLNETTNVNGDVFQFTGSNIWVNDTSSISTFRGEINVQNKAVFGGSNVYLSDSSGKFEVTGATKLNDLEVSGATVMADMNLSGSLQVGQTITQSSASGNNVITGMLNVFGNTKFATDVITVTKNGQTRETTIAGATTLNGLVTVGDNFTVTQAANGYFQKDIIVSNTAYINNNLEVTNNVAIGGVLSVSDGDIIGSDNLDISGNMTVQGSNAHFAFQGASGNVSIMSNLYVQNQVGIDGSLTVSGGDITASDDLAIVGDLDVAGDANFSGITSNSSMSIEDNVFLVTKGGGSVFSVTKVGTSGTGVAAVTGNMEVSGDLDVAGSIALAGVTATNISATTLTATSTLSSPGLSATSTGINVTKVLTSSQNIIGPTGIRCNLAVYDASGTLLNTATT